MGEVEKWVLGKAWQSLPHELRQKHAGLEDLFTSKPFWADVCMGPMVRD
jgi:hypothetical protein